MNQSTEKSIIYVARDIERAIGYLVTDTPIFIISNDSPFAKSIQTKYPDRIVLISNNTPLSTRELLAHPTTTTLLSKLINPKIIVFKPTQVIEKWCDTHGYTLINPKAKLAENIEQKITQLTTLQNLSTLMPPYQVKLVKDIAWDNTSFILQFNHSHTGSGTLLIDSEHILKNIARRFPNRDARIAPFIPGIICTNNIVVSIDTIMSGNISYQITGLTPFTDHPFATIGNDWEAPHHILDKDSIASYHHMAHTVGDELRRLGWKGLCGIDAIWSKEEKRWYLIEINARQPASASYESILQSQATKQDNTCTILEAHLHALTETSLQQHTLIPIHTGAQIIQRVTKTYTSHTMLKTAKQKLQQTGFEIIQYNNTTTGADLLRIQSRQGLIQEHNTFNNLGKQIATIITNS